MNTLEQFVNDHRLHQEFVELINNHSYPNAAILDKFRRLGMTIKKTNEEIEGDSVTLFYETKYKGQISR